MDTQKSTEARHTIPQQTGTPQPTTSYNTITFEELLYLVWGHFWQIMLCTLLGAVLAFCFTYYFIVPEFQATARIYIISASNKTVVDLTDLQVGESLTADYQELLLSRPLLQDVIQELGLSMDYKDLEKMIDITNTDDTRILKIVVTDSDPQEAADIANELVEQASIYLPKIMETDAPNLVEDAVPPTQKSSPSYTKNTLLGAMIGAMLCCSLLLIRRLMNDTFVTPDDISQYFGVQPLSTIPEADLGDFNRPKKKVVTRKGPVHEKP